MWLLSTDRAELHAFPSPEDVPGGYAILSHVWDKKEQSFQDTQLLHELCGRIGTNPRDSSCAKIRNACVLAESHGYKWLWVDTSCIDKTSSADLSEAINSMYQYYSLAKICYAYLGDVPPATTVQLYDPFSRSVFAFRGSAWHTRGWTLQELIAPAFLLFVAEDWTNIGTKAELAKLLEQVTKVPADLLTRKATMSNYSIAQRMSWAALRETTRLEDRAYSLLGIFGLTMPPLYGEGEHAFYRLQEEIMKRFVDTTLFAWSLSVLPRLGDEPERPTHQWSHSIEESRGGRTIKRRVHVETSLAADTYLFAPTPEAFQDCADIGFEPPVLPDLVGQDDSESKRPFMQHPTVNSGEHSLAGTLNFLITPYGVRAHCVPLIKHQPENGEMIAFLFWTNHLGDPIGLRLRPCSLSMDPLHPRYDVVHGRLAYLRRDEHHQLVDNDDRPVSFHWREIYISHRPTPEPHLREDMTKVSLPMNFGLSAPFRISEETISDLSTSSPYATLTKCTLKSLPWDGTPPVILQLTLGPSNHAMIHLGMCTRTQRNTSLDHWASVVFTSRDLDSYVEGGEGSLSHCCDSDHIHKWDNKTKSFRYVEPEDERGAENGNSVLRDLVLEPVIILRFEAWPVSPSTTLVTYTQFGFQDSTEVE